jgi:hypothetical protein
MTKPLNPNWQKVIDGCECFDCKYARNQQVTHRDDSGIPDWLLQDNATYFSQLHRAVDDVPAQMGFRLPYKRS